MTTSLMSKVKKLTTLIAKEISGQVTLINLPNKLFVPSRI